MKLTMMIVLLAHLALAGNAPVRGPLLQKVFRTSDEGPVSTVACTLWPDRLVVERTTEDLQDKQVSPLEVSGDFGKVFSELRQDDIKLVEKGGNAALTQWIAFSSNGERVVLRSDGPVQGTNSSAAATKLIQFIELHCRPCYLGMRM